MIHTFRVKLLKVSHRYLVHPYDWITLRHFTELFLKQMIVGAIIINLLDQSKTPRFTNLALE